MDDLPSRVSSLAAGAGLVPREPVARPGRPPEVGQIEGLTALARRQAWRDAIPARFAWASVDDFANPEGVNYAPDVAGDLTAWGSPDCAANLIVTGSTGAGKTHAAVAAARLKFDRGLDVTFAPVVELLHDLRPGGPDGLLDELSFVDVLVLDDLGAEKASEWTTEQLYAVVNRRWMECLPTIATSNLPIKEFRGAVGGRVFSRLLGDSVLVSMSGDDRRLAT